MIAHLSTNRAGMWCRVTNGDEYQAYPTRELAEQAVDHANSASARAVAKRAARELAQSNLGQLAKRLRVGLHIMPDILPSSTAIAKPFGKAVCA